MLYSGYATIAKSQRWRFPKNTLAVQFPTRKKNFGSSANRISNRLAALVVSSDLNGKLSMRYTNMVTLARQQLSC